MNRRPAVTLALALMLSLAACRSPQQKAAIAEARYDQYYASGDYLRARVEIRNAIRNDEDQPGYWVKLARVEMQLQNVQGVYASYSRALELQRDNVEALEWMATLSVASHDDAGAKKYLDTLMVLQPKDVRGRLTQGTLALRNDHPDQAITIADGILADAPGEPDAVILKAMAFEKQGKLQDAIDLIETRLHDGTTAPLLAKLLDFYQEQNNVAGIRNTYVRLFHLRPNDVDLQIQFARVLFARGEPGEALRMIRRVQVSRATDSAVQIKVIRFYAETAGPAVAMMELQRLAATGNAKMKVALASYLLEDQEPASARRLVEPLVAGKDVDADNIDAQLVYATSLKNLGDTGAAWSLFNKIIAFDQTNSRALLQRTDMEVKQRKLDEALTDVRVLVRDNPDFEPGALMLGEVYAARGDQQLARRAFLNAANAFPASALTLRTFTDYLWQQHDVQGALEATQAFVTANPKSAEGWEVRGEACLQAADEPCTREAIDTLGSLPNGGPAQRLLLSTLDQRKAAGHILPVPLSNAINKIIDGSLPLRDVIQALAASHRVPEARAILSQVVQRQPSNVQAQIDYAGLAMISGDEPRGRALLRGILARDARQPRAYIDLAYSWHRSGDDDAAFKTLAQGLKAMPGNLDLLNGLAGLQVVAGQADAAVATYRRVLAVNPQNLFVINNLASLLTDTARTPADRAEAVRVAAPLARVDQPAFEDTRGWALFQAGNTAEALPLLKRAVQQGPDVAVFAYHLGAATMASGDHKGGQRLLQSALSRADRKDSWVGAARALLAQS